jgi:methylmalonyl-CoA/ethylmalonyl-CoA epimerase
VVPDIRLAAPVYVRRFGYRAESDIIHDPTQTAYVQFFRLPEDSLYLELVAPDGENSKLTGAVKRGGGLNHLCYLTDDIRQACNDLRAEQMVPIHPPVPAVAFPGGRIAWMFGEDRTPVELLQLGSADSA